MTPGRVERRARWLLGAYPWRVRAEQGGEIVGTVLDALPPGSDRLPLRVQLDLVRGGWRVRARRRPPWPVVLAYSVGLRIGPEWIAWVYDDLEDPDYVRVKRRRIVAGTLGLLVVVALLMGDPMVLLIGSGSTIGSILGVPRDRQRRRQRYGLVPGGSDPTVVWVERHRRALLPHVPVAGIVVAVGVLLVGSGLAAVAGVVHQSPNGDADMPVDPPAPPDVLGRLVPALLVGAVVAVLVAATGLALTRRSVRSAGRRPGPPPVGFGVGGAVVVPLVLALGAVAGLGHAVLLHWQWVPWTNARVPTALLPVGVTLLAVGARLALAGRRRGVPLGLWDLLPVVAPRSRPVPMAWWWAQALGAEPWRAGSRHPSG